MNNNIKEYNPDNFTIELFLNIVKKLEEDINTFNKNKHEIFYRHRVS